MSGKYCPADVCVCVLILDQDQHRTNGLAGNQWGETDLHPSEYKVITSRSRSLFN
jgi:hypothetical protein